MSVTGIVVLELIINQHTVIQSTESTLTRVVRLVKACFGGTV